ncbi:hypothetical protein [uncultured Chryseobacterium sp.]|uniref:hypothetical protein n=1 Tax=uncultured Chryseobacterium sp. TaxID=259322 RepID=UPI0025D0F98F|nr:hypothetical protein [uncultured Chryseobacterium sp.]
MQQLDEWKKEAEIRDWRNITIEDLKALPYRKTGMEFMTVSKEMYDYFKKCGIIETPVIKPKKKQNSATVKFRPTKEQIHISTIVDKIKSSFTQKHIYIYNLSYFEIKHFRNDMYILNKLIKLHIQL